MSNTLNPGAVIITGAARARTTATEPGDIVTATKTPNFWALVNHATGGRFYCTAEFIRRYITIKTQITGPQAGKDDAQ